MTLKRDSNFEEKLTFCLKNDMENLVNFNPSNRKFENLHFDERLNYVLFQLRKYRGVVS